MAQIYLLGVTEGQWINSCKRGQRFQILLQGCQIRHALNVCILFTLTRITKETISCLASDMIDIAFIVVRNSLVDLLEAICAQKYTWKHHQSSCDCCIMSLACSCVPETETYNIQIMYAHWDNNAKVDWHTKKEGNIQNAPHKNTLASKVLPVVAYTIHCATGALELQQREQDEKTCAICWCVEDWGQAIHDDSLLECWQEAEIVIEDRVPPMQCPAVKQAAAEPPCEIWEALLLPQKGARRDLAKNVQ